MPTPPPTPSGWTPAGSEVEPDGTVRHWLYLDEPPEPEPSPAPSAPTRRRKSRASVDVDVDYNIDRVISDANVQVQRDTSKSNRANVNLVQKLGWWPTISLVIFGFSLTAGVVRTAFPEWFVKAGAKLTIDRGERVDRVDRGGTRSSNYSRDVLRKWLAGDQAYNLLPEDIEAARQAIEKDGGTLP